MVASGEILRLSGPASRPPTRISLRYRGATIIVRYSGGRRNPCSRDVSLHIRGAPTKKLDLSRPEIAQPLLREISYFATCKLAASWLAGLRAVRL